MTRSDRSVESFSDDILSHGGYAYTTDARLSSRLANRRLTEAVLALADWEGCRVLDIGCGDGTYTFELGDERAIRSGTGVDPNVPALGIAATRKGSRPLAFIAASADRLPFPDDSFDVGQIRGVLHHMDQPVAALREALRVCPAVVIIEPNGYNPVLKILERCSEYHRRHGEKSYGPARVDRWIASIGGQVGARRFVGLVPMFCPDWMARLLKRLEPAVERIWPLNRIACAVYAFRVDRRSEQ